MTTLRVIIDQILAPVPGGIGRYAEELTRGLIRTAPPGCTVEGIVSASTEEEYAYLGDRLPGLDHLYKTAFDRRQLAAAWQAGFTRLPGRGMIHATSLLAPLHRHDRVNDDEQIVVTMHDAVPWTHPETLTPRGVSWHKAMAKRAAKYADAIVVPTHAVAQEVGELLPFGDRIRVIGGAPTPGLRVPEDADERAARLELPERYVLAVGTVEPRKGLDALIAAMAEPAAGDLPLLVVGPKGWGDVSVEQLAADAGLPADRVRTLGKVDDDDLAVLMNRATVFVFPSRAEGFGLPVLEAFALGAPVIHSDVPALVEVAGDAGLTVPLYDPEGYPSRLAETIGRVANDRALADSLRVLGADRARAFSWNGSAEKVWQLHADL